MSQQDLTITMLVDKSPKQVFDAINNVRGWWSSSLEGESEKLNDEFKYRHKDIHYSQQRLIEVVPDKKVVWLVLDSSLNFIEHKTEWNGTKVIFEINENNGKTEMVFTHEGLVPSCECYEACNGGWNFYMHSLKNLIETGKGQPN